MTPAALKAEIQTGPHAAALAPFVASGNDTAIAAFLNSQTGAGAASVNRATIAKPLLMEALIPVVLALSAANPAIQGKWDRFLSMLRSVETFRIPVINALLQMVVADGLMSQAQVDAIKVQTGSRAELLFGIGTVVSITDVAGSLRNANGTPK